MTTSSTSSPSRISDLRAHVERRVAEAVAAAGFGDEPPPLAAPPNPDLGDYGLPCFALAKVARRAPPLIAAAVAEHLIPDEMIGEVTAAGPYVNLRLRRDAVAAVVLGQALGEGERFGCIEPADDAELVMVEYSSPNTNKPQHLGHVRNNLLGYSVCELLRASGRRVIRANLVNDRGIHICKSMLAYSRWGQGRTPVGDGVKGDHFVGSFYVLFETRLREEYAAWLDSPAAETERARWMSSPAGVAAQKAAAGGGPSGSDAFAAAYKQDYFNAHSELGAAARELLRQWEAGDPETVALWRAMNGWVLKGFHATYDRLGVAFDRFYFESETYLLGKEIVEEGLARGVLERDESGAITFDLARIGKQGKKVLLRSDGTSVYMTQDLGTAAQRFDQHALAQLYYVVADEQEYHFEVLFGVLGALRPERAGACTHLSYGMVHLPEGKMKSREGTVVDADDLMDEMRRLARAEIDERVQSGVGEALPDAEADARAEAIGLAALKYYLLNFTPKSAITFDPKKSIDFLGQTGPYCLYAYARVMSLLRRHGEPVGAEQLTAEVAAWLDSDLETAVLRELAAFPTTVAFAARTIDPSKVADHVWKIAKAFASLYNDRGHAILTAEEPPRRLARLLLARAVANALGAGLHLLGIRTLDQM